MCVAAMILQSSSFIWGVVYEDIVAASLKRFCVAHATICQFPLPLPLPLPTGHGDVRDMGNTCVGVI